MDNMKYAAFISYRHGGVDEFAAKNLHRMLETYKIPTALAKRLGKKKIGRIFRDVDELPTSSSLYGNIEEALRQSEFLIVICTPRLQQSKWCMQEIQLFKELRGQDHILAVLVDGEPQDSFPVEITHRMVNGELIEVEPLAADVRGETDHKRKRKMHTERLRLLAAMLGCEFDQLRQREHQQMVRRRMIAGSIASAIVLCFLVLMAAENLRLQAQVRRTQEAQSYLLTEYSNTAYHGDDPMTAALLSLEGLPKDLGNSRPFVGASLAALTDSLQVYDYKRGYTADRIISSETMDCALLSPDGKYVVYVDLKSGTEYNAHFYDIQKSEAVASFPVDSNYCSYTSCNAKVAFFGDQMCAVAGKDGMLVIDLNTMEVQWKGMNCSAVEISKDASTLVAYNSVNEELAFYQPDGTLISSKKWDGEDDSTPYGISDDGKYYAISEIPEDDSITHLYIIDTKTSKALKTLEDGDLLDGIYYHTAWSGHKLSYCWRHTSDESVCYAYYDMDKQKEYRTDAPVDDDVQYVDGDAGEVYYFNGSSLYRINMKNGKRLDEYIAGAQIQATEYVGDGKWEIACADGSLEYMDYTDTPYLISRSVGDGTSCSQMRIGGNYMLTYLVNSYQVRLYRLNDKSADKSCELLKLPNEVCVYVIRKGNLLCINTSDNTYTVNVDTLDMKLYPAPISFIDLPNQKITTCDNLDGTITVFDATTGQGLGLLPDNVTLMGSGAYVTDTENRTMTRYRYEKGGADKNIVASETKKLPENCTNAYITDGGYLVCECESEDSHQLHIFDSEDTEILTADVDSINEGDNDCIIYRPKGSAEYAIFDMKTCKQIVQQDFGNVDWWTPASEDYIYISSTDTGGYIVSRKTGEVVLTLPDVSTVYTFSSNADSAYFSLLYLAERGETRLDVYEKKNPSSPIAKVNGGMALNDADEVLIYDGQSRVYATPLMDRDTIYQKGVDFIGTQSLTERQKQEYHCQ